MKNVISLIAACMMTLVIASCGGGSKTEAEAKKTEIPRTIGGIELLSPISQYPQFKESLFSFKFGSFPLMEGVKVYESRQVNEFEPLYIGVKNGKIVFIGVWIFGAPHIEKAKREIYEKYGDSDGKTSVEFCPTEYSPYNGADINGCVVYADEGYKNEVRHQREERQRSEQNQLNDGLNRL